MCCNTWNVLFMFRDLLSDKWLEKVDDLPVIKLIKSYKNFWKNSFFFLILVIKGLISLLLKAWIVFKFSWNVNIFDFVNLNHCHNAVARGKWLLSANLSSPDIVNWSSWLYRWRSSKKVKTQAAPPKIFTLTWRSSGTKACFNGIGSRSSF